MKQKMERYDVGCIVARFQASELHEGHLALIQGVVDNHSQVIIFLGLSPLIGTISNPLNFEARKQMILEKFPDVNVLYIKDSPSDEAWSKNLDEQINSLVSPTQTVALYGSRDSFIDRYHGKYPTIELEPEFYISATELRIRDGKKVTNSPDFRRGVIWATQNRFPAVYPTVDVGIIDYDNSGEPKRILLARKKHQDKYRFVGGFAEPNSETFEDDAKREVHEETGLLCEDFKYLGSFKINDWRYKNETDKIKTMFFIATYTFGRPEALDDIIETRWFEIDKMSLNDIVPEHQPLFKKLMEYFNIKEYIWFKADDPEHLGFNGTIITGSPKQLKKAKKTNL